MDNLELDKYCIEILMVLIEKGYSSSFNKLHEAIGKSGFSFSIPTLSKHLKHLEKAGYIRHEKKGAQMIIYSVNTDKIENIKKIWNRMKNITDSVQINRKEFFSRPENEQIEIVLQLLAIRKLNEIRAQIAHMLDATSLEKQFEVAFWASPYVLIDEAWMIGKSLEDEGYRKRVLKIIDEWLKPKTKQTE